MNTVTKQITINTQHEVIGALDDCATACESAYQMLGIGESAAQRARKAAELLRAETSTPENRTVAPEDTTSLEWLTTNAAFDMYAVTSRLSVLFNDLSEHMTATQRAEMLDAFGTLAPFMLGMKQRAGNDPTDGEEPVQEFARFYERVVQASLQSAKRFVLAFDGLENGRPKFKVVLRKKEEEKTEGEQTGGAGALDLGIPLDERAKRVVKRRRRGEEGEAEHKTERGGETEEGEDAGDAQRPRGKGGRSHGW